MKYKLLGFAFSIVSAFIGCALPFISIGSYVKHPINVIWGFIYGLGWYAAALLSGPRNPWAQLFGGKIWPLLMMGSIVYAAGLLRNVRNPTRTVVMLVLFVSLFVVLPRRFIIGSPLDNIPTYSDILSVVY